MPDDAMNRAFAKWAASLTPTHTRGDAFTAGWRAAMELYRNALVCLREGIVERAMDTVWISEIETAVDFIDAVLEAPDPTGAP